MSSLERPSTPQPPAQPGGVRDDADRHSEIPESFDLKLKSDSLLPADNAFVNKHLTKCPENILKKICIKKNLELIGHVRNARQEINTYRPASKLLTNMSTSIWKFISKRTKQLHLDRYKNALEFVDHHGSAPTHYPFGDVEDKPDLLGVFPVHGFSWEMTKGGSATRIPHYRIETIVELKAFDGSGAAEQTADYALQHLRARPDHPGLYSLTMRRKGFIVVYSDTSGTYLSDEFSWDRMDVLASFIYSIYDPPKGHMLRDPTLEWEPSIPKDPLSPPLWTVYVGGKRFARGELVFGGDPCGRRTTIFKCSWPDSGFCVLVKDYYRQLARRFDEGKLVNGIHTEGFVPGVIRFVYVEDVMDGGKPLRSGEGTEERTRRRFLMGDYGVKLVEAKSINDLLKAVYDVLEVHRTLVMERKVLHRDMSIYNILMYPQWGKFNDTRFMEQRPPLIDDVLAGELRDPATYQANCLLIDFDNAAELQSDGAPNELTCRTGTPMYISRAVGAGRIWEAIVYKYFKMPELSPDARTLYDKVHGPARYNLFSEGAGTFHGGTPAKDEDEDNRELSVQFYHKPEYDAESVFWSALSALLQVKPANDEENEDTSECLQTVWELFEAHKIENRKKSYLVDHRESAFFLPKLKDYCDFFLPSMKDVGVLLYDLARQVAPSYARMDTPPPRPDHLHEAMQRLILNYLVDHRDRDIPLDPTNLRSTKGPQKRKPGPQSQPEVKPTGSTNSRKRTRELEVVVGERQSKRLAITREASLPDEATQGFHFEFKPRD